MQIRPYQQEAVKKAVLGLQESPQRTLLALPTGSGKTVVGLMAAAHFAGPGGKVLWLAYQRELLAQAQRELAQAQPSVRQTNFIFDTVQSFSNYRMPNGISLIVVDEAHHLHSSNQYWTDLKNRKRPILGLTATPRRSSWGSGWSLAYHLSRAELTPRYLSVPVVFRHKTGFTPQHVDQTQLFAGWEFDAATYRSLDEPVRNMIIAQHLKRHERRLGRMLAFVHTTDHCMSLADTCGKIGLRAAYVHGQLSATEREDVFRDFRNGAVQVLINAKLVSEGIDVPGLDTIVLAVPTMSDIRFAQMIGRGCRKTDAKSHFYIVDFVDNLGRFQQSLEERYLYDGASAGRAAGVSADQYKSVPSWSLDQPYLAQLCNQVATGFSCGPQALAMQPHHVEEHLRQYAQRHGVALSLDGARPMEVHLVHEHVFPLVCAAYPEAAVRKEMACEDGSRCDIFIAGYPATVIEFSTQRVGPEKGRQLLGYCRRFQEEGRAQWCQPVLVAISYEQDATSRGVVVDGEPVQFLNWHDFLRLFVLQVSSWRGPTGPFPPHGFAFPRGGGGA